MKIQRKSYSEINRSYFFKAADHQWVSLLTAKENTELTCFIDNEKDVFRVPGTRE